MKIVHQNDTKKLMQIISFNYMINATINVCVVNVASYDDYMLINS